MNELQIFSNPQFGQVRTITEDGVTLFCGSDVAKALGYKKPRDAISAHCRYTVKRGIPHPQAPAKTIEMLFIPEGDIYRLVVRSELPGADAFERWIFDEVLPSIRRTGAYIMPEAARVVPKPQPEVSLIGLAKVAAAARRAVLDMGGTRWEAGAEVLGILEHCGLPIPEFAKREKITLKLSDFF